MTTTTPTRSRRGKWWVIVVGALVVILGVAAAIIIPQVLQAQRVATYNEVMSKVDFAGAEALQYRTNADLTTILYSLQFSEAGEFQESIDTLSDYSDHYFSDKDRAALAEVSEALAAVLEDERLSELEAETVASAMDVIEENGFVWQTGYLNLTPDAMQPIIEITIFSAHTRVADEDVTDGVVEEARDLLADTEALLAEAERSFGDAQARATLLTDAVARALVPLRSAAESAPDQVDVVLGMYPNTDQSTTNLLRDSALTASTSVGAELFTVDAHYLAVPVEDATADTQDTFEVTDAWRSVIIAEHLNSYSDAITAAWLADRGGIDDVLRGINPFLPFG